MSIQYFYNFCLKDIDDTDLGGDLLTGVRESFFLNGSRIKDKITGNSDAQPLFYEFLLEKEKPMKWLVKDSSGTKMQEVMLSDNGKYYLYFYRDQKLFKRLLFSKHHTLLKAEYFDPETGVVRHTLEPRKAQNDLCILYTVKTSAQPIPLFEEPEISDDRVRSRMVEDFTNYTAIAATDKGIMRFLSDPQLAEFNSLKEKYQSEAEKNQEESFVGDDTPLLDKIKANDFNVKRNLSGTLDITLAMEFGTHDEAEESPAEYHPQETEQAVSAESVPAVRYRDDTVLVDGYQSATEDETEKTVSDAPTEITENVTDEISQTDQPSAPESDDNVPTNQTEQSDENTTDQPENKAEPVPDKRIMADGAVYDYYGELDERGNRSGYGRTMTDEGRTAYEGHYENDKRSGNGSYFYKSGALCYTGDWRENVRHGTGVGVSSRDGSIHVGNWKNNKPDGNGVRLTHEGDIKFVCKELSDGTTVLMHYMPDDTVIVSKYDKFGMKLGDTTISLKDLPI